MSERWKLSLKRVFDKKERKSIEKIREIKRRGNLSLKTIYLVRHCEAEGQAPEAALTLRGSRQAENLANHFIDLDIKRIITSPYVRAAQSILPLAELVGIEAEEDERLKEWRLSVSPLVDWQSFLKQSFSNLDICYEGGESAREAMTRGISVMRETLDAMGQGKAVIVTHGGLMTLMLKHFDDRVGFSEWASLSNPDVFLLSFTKEGPYPQIERMMGNIEN